MFDNHGGKKMKIAVMQPYFFPYIGYWQLIHAADCFVLFDDAQYIRNGWVNRNRILKPDGDWQYILVPIKKHAHTDSIKNIHVHPDIRWKERIIRQLTHYKKKAPCFRETDKLIREILSEVASQKIADINLTIIRGICKYLGIKREMFLSSEKNFDYSNVGDAGEWALRISEQMGASEYINPVSGANLFAPDKFAAAGIKLSFLKPRAITYDQRGNFEPSLSIIDVMMFNSADSTRQLLAEYDIIPPEAASGAKA